VYTVQLIRIYHQTLEEVASMTSIFYGAIVGTKKVVPYVPRPKEASAANEMVNLSSACIPASVQLKTGTRVSLYVKLEDCEKHCLGNVLNNECNPTASLFHCIVVRD
jgi:hypothetical protein